MIDRLREQWRANRGEAGAMRAQQATARARRRALGQRLYHQVNELFVVHPADFFTFLQLAGKWILLGGAAGVLAGTASYIFLITLAWATATRLAQPALLYALPFIGCGVGWLYYRFGGAAALGNNLVIDEVNNNRAQIPWRMAPLVLLGTVLTHLGGGSAGREGTAIQMGASLADGLRRLLGLSGEDRRLLLMAGISGGFSSVFGVPAAGFVFGMEVQGIGRIRYEGIIPCLVAAFVGDLVGRAWGAPHSHYPQFQAIPLDALLVLKVALAGVAFGLTSLLFVELTHGIKQLMSRLSPWTPLYPLLGGVAVIGLTWLVGTRDYLGLSLPLITASVEGTGVMPGAFALKLLFTAITLGTGYLGGEVTPLFVIGATLGDALQGVLGGPPGLLAAVGLVAVFAGASNTPLACAIMGIELFGGGLTPYLFLGCVVAYLASGHRGIYMTQRVHEPKTAVTDLQAEESLHSLRARHGGWLPPIPRLSSTLEQKRVRTLMTAPAVAVQADESLQAVVAKALQAGIRALPVLDEGGQVIGIITDNDLLRGELAINLHQLQQMTPTERAPWLATAASLQAAQVMSQPVISVRTSATVADALTLLRRHNLKRLPVLDEDGRLAGLLTRSDLLRELAFEQVLAGEQSSFFDWRVRVGEVEREAAVTVAATTPLHTVVALLQQALQMRAVVVDEAGHPIGMLSESDLLRRVAPSQRGAVMAALHEPGKAADLYLPQPAAELMTTPLLTVTADSAAFDAIRLLMTNQIKRLPVVDANGQVIGLVNRRTLLYGLLRRTEPVDVL